MWLPDDRHAVLLANVVAVVMGLEGMCLEDGILDTWRRVKEKNHETPADSSPYNGGKKPLDTKNMCLPNQETC